jgi:nitrilase
MKANKPTARLAAVQAAPEWLDRKASVEKACALIIEAGANGANIVGFPENFIPGHPVWYYFYPATSEKSTDFATRLFQNSVELPSEDSEALCAAAARAGINVVMGLTERVPGTTGTLYNTQLFIDSTGHITGKHQKLVPTIGERLVHAGGRPDTQITFTSEFGNIGALACGENSNPLAVAMVAGAYPTVHVASWPNHFIPEYCGMRESSLLVSRNIAYTCKSFVISSCGVNSETMIRELASSAEHETFLRDPDKSGGTCIVAPSGDIIAGPMDGDQEGILYADVDFVECIRGRYVHDVSGHYNRTDVYQLRINNEPSELIQSRSRRAASGVNRSNEEVDEQLGSNSDHNAF